MICKSTEKEADLPRVTVSDGSGGSADFDLKFIDANFSAMLGGKVHNSALRWLLPSLIIVSAQAAVSATLAVRLSINLWPPVIQYIEMAFGFVALFCSFALLIAVFRLVLEKDPRPGSALFDLVKEQRHRLGIVVMGSVLMLIQWSLLTWSKVTIPGLVGFWADPYLADLDAVIFLGHDPWTVFHFANFSWVEAVYYSWFPVMVASIVWFLCQKPSLNRDRAILSYLLTLSLVGMLSIYLLPSGGPIFYERLGFGDRFADLPYPQATIDGANYLWAIHAGTDDQLFGAGISAMPSMHVALAYWLAVHALRFRWAAWSFFAVIAFGSVYLGWHYVTDGVAGVIGTWACTNLAEWWLRQAEPASASATVPE